MTKGTVNMVTISTVDNNLKLFFQTEKRGIDSGHTTQTAERFIRLLEFYGNKC